MLNREYFSAEQLRTVIANLHAYVADGGLLLVSRNLGPSDGETEHGSIWRRESLQFRRLRDFGDGSEVAAEVDAFAVAP